MIQFDDSHVCSNGLKLNHQVVIQVPISKSDVTHVH